MTRRNEKTIRKPQKLEWVEEIEYYPVFVDRQAFAELQKLERPQIVDYCIGNIKTKLEHMVFSVNREELSGQIDDMFEIMGEEAPLPCNSYLMMVRLNRMSEEI